MARKHHLNQGTFGRATFVESTQITIESILAMNKNGRKSLGGRKSIGSRQRTHYSFPILKDSEIIECVNNMGISLSESELRQPNFQVLRLIFSNAIELLMGITADELNQPKFDGLGALSYPDLHEESVPRLNLFRMSSKLLQTCGCHEFSLQDLVKPTSDKLRIYLSSVINFAKFREDQLDVFSVKTEKQDQLASDLEDKTSNIDTLTRKIDEINVQHEKDMPVIIDLQEQKKALKSEMKARGEEHKKSLKEKDHIKEEYNAVSDKTASIQYQIQNLEADIESLSTQVVQSPDRLKAELSELDRRFAEETNVLRDMEQQKEVDSAQERIRLDAIKHLKKTMEHMRTLEKQQKKYKEAYKTFKANKSKISSLESELTEQNALNEHYVHRTSTCGKKQEAIDDQSSDRTQIQTLKKQQGEYDILNLAHEGGKQELQSILCDIENVKNQTKSDIEAHKQRMHKQFQLLKTTVDNFHMTNDNFVAALE